MAVNGASERARMTFSKILNTEFTSAGGLPEHKINVCLTEFNKEFENTIIKLIICVHNGKMM